MGKSVVSIIPPFMLYVFSYLLLWEWLLPLGKLDMIRDMSVFLLYLVCLFLLNFFSVRWRWIIFFQLSFIYVTLYVLYYQSYSIFTGQWLVTFWMDSMNSISAIRQQQWSTVPYSVGTFLFLLLLWTITFFIHYWVIRRKSILFFLILTILFVAVLDTFTPYDSDAAIIRIFVIGLFSMGCLRFYRLIDEEKLIITWKDWQRWMIPLVGMIVISLGLGLVIPKLPAQWPDPVPTLITYSKKFKEEPSSKKVGYSEDDTQLGGDFIRDDTVVFTVLADKKQYWLVESKTRYTGAGWEYTSEDMLSENFENGETIPYDNIVSSHLKSSQTYSATVQMKRMYNHVPIPYPLKEGEITADGLVMFKLYPHLQKIHSRDDNGGLKPLEKYELTYMMPVYDVAQLRSIQKKVPEQLHPDYIQLPEYLPSRIKALAEEIVKEENNLYDMVKAVEDYFDGPQFEYAREDIPYPEQEEDFVDQFLFETQRGYCDHFSTSMIILLRTLGIEARWVKGYTGGDFVKYEAGQNVYKITNNNAHSWVEVNFPGVGWVPFEPTKGYNNLARFDNAIKGNSLNTNQTVVQPEQPKEKSQRTEQRKQSTATEIISLSDIMEFLKVYKWEISLIAGALVALVAIGYLTRIYWLAFFWFMYFQKQNKPETFSVAYMALLRQLNRRGLKKKIGQTLREYAKEVDKHYSFNEMSQLTDYYERVFYGGNDTMTEWKQAKILWEKVMKKTIT